MRLFSVHDRQTGDVVGVWHQDDFDHKPEGYANIGGNYVAVNQFVKSFDDLYLTDTLVWAPINKPDLQRLPKGHLYRVEITVTKDGEKIGMAGGDATADNFLEALGELQGIVNSNWAMVRQYATIGDKDAGEIPDF